MKLAVIADIHGNYPALCTVLDDLEKWKPEFVWVAGDVINRGPRPKACLDLILQKCGSENWVYLNGNHEDYVVERSRKGDPRSGPMYELFLPSLWTYEQISRDVSGINDLPFQHHKVFPNAGEVRVSHASIAGNRAGIYPFMSEIALGRLIPPQSDVFCVGHTHYPLIRQVYSTLVVNAGAVGLPFDGDQRAAYAQISFLNGTWYAEIIRLPYDIDRAHQDFYQSGFIPNSGPISSIILKELELSQALLGTWVSIFEEEIILGRVSVKDSVEKFLTGYI